MNQLLNGTDLRTLLIFGATESDIEKQENDYKQAESNKNININLGEFTHVSPFSSSRKAINKQTIAPAISRVKVILSLIVARSEKFGKIKTAPKNPAAMFVKRADSTLSLEAVTC